MFTPYSFSNSTDTTTSLEVERYLLKDLSDAREVKKSLI